IGVVEREPVALAGSEVTRLLMVLLLVHRDAEHDQPLAAVFRLDFVQLGNRLLARLAPRRPVVEQHDLALELVERDLLAVEAGRLELRRGLRVRQRDGRKEEREQEQAHYSSRLTAFSISLGSDGMPRHAATTRPWRSIRNTEGITSTPQLSAYLRSNAKR